MRFSSLVLALTFAAWAQAPGVARVQAPAKIAAAAHSTAQAAFVVTIAPGFHIQSNHPKLDYLIPSTIELQPAHGVSVERVAWPKAQEHKFSFSADPLAVFEGTLKIPVTLKTSGPGVAELHGTFRYQACNDQMCRPPVKVPLTLEVDVR